MPKQKTLQRQDLMLDPEDVLALQRLLCTTSRSEAVRKAVQDRIFVEKVLQAHRGIQDAGGLADVYGRARRRRKR